MCQLPVVENDQCIGSLIEHTLMSQAMAEPTMLDRPVREVMGAPFPAVEPTLTLDRLAPMLTQESPAALVVDGGKPAGIVSRYDVLRVMIGR